MSVPGAERDGLDQPVDAVLADRWFQGLYDTPLLFSGILDRDGRVLAANTLSIEGCGLDRAEIMGRPFWEGGWWSPDGAVAEQVRAWCEGTVRTGEPLRALSQYFLGDGQERLVDLALFPVKDGDVVTHVVATGNDITDAVLAQQQRQERELVLVQAAERLAADRLDQLSSISLRLVDIETMEDLERIVIEHSPHVLGADACILAVRDEQAGVVRLAVSDGGVAAGVGHEELLWTSPLPLAQVAKTGEAVILRSKDEAVDWFPATRDPYDGWAGAASVTLPLKVGDRLLGALCVGWRAEREFREDELGLLRGFAAQCAQTLDRVRRHEADLAAAHSARLMSEVLQRSSLTQPPTPDALEIAVRYQPAEQAAQIGGDWYDAFVDASGATLLAVGDVNGHDQKAAATMGQVRNLLRGLAFDTDDGPSRLLTRLDSALRGLQLDTLATAVVARIEQDAPPANPGIRRLRWSSAGHLPPLLLAPDGTVTRLEVHHDLLLGVEPQISRHEQTVDLPAGSTLLLYTDGLVEQRNRSLDEGIDGLAAALSELGHLDPERLCDALIGTASVTGPGAVDDDIALLVLHCAG